MRGVLLQAAPQLTGDDVAEYRAEVEMMAGRFKETADWLARVSPERAPRVVIIRMFCLVRSRSPARVTRVKYEAGA